MFSKYNTVILKAANAIHDLRIMIHRFAYEENFSKDSRGGGTEHNLNAIPYMWYLCHFLNKYDKAYI